MPNLQRMFKANEAIGVGVALVAFLSVAGAAAARSKKDSASYRYCKNVAKATDSPKDCPGFH